MMEQNPSEPLVRFRRNGYDVYAKNDGRDYWAVVEAYLRGELPATPLGMHRDGKRRVYLVEAAGRQYVLKWATMGTPGFKRFFPWYIGLTYFTHILRKVDLALRRGCGATHDIYLVAEKWTGVFRQEVLVLMEYVKGESLGNQPEFAPYRDALRTAMTDMRKHGLTLSDFNASNFIVTGGGIKIIDLACRVPTSVNLIKDAMKLKEHYGVDLPVEGMVSELLHVIYSGLDKAGRLYRGEK